MLRDHFGEIHAIELVAREDDDIVGLIFQKKTEALTNRIGRALKPRLGTGRLLGGKDADESLGEGVERVGAMDVPVQRLAVELGQHIDASDRAIDAVRDRDIDQTVLAGDRYGRLGTVARQGKQPGTLTATEDDGNGVFRMQLAHSSDLMDCFARYSRVCR